MQSVERSQHLFFLKLTQVESNSFEKKKTSVLKCKNKSLKKRKNWVGRAAALFCDVASNGQHAGPLPPTDSKSSEAGSGRKKGRGKPPPPSLPPPTATPVGGQRTGGRSREGRPVVTAYCLRRAHACTLTHAQAIYIPSISTQAESGREGGRLPLFSTWQTL